MAVLAQSTKQLLPNMFDSRGLDSDAHHLVLKTRILYYVFVTLIVMPCPLDQDYSVDILT